MQLTATLEQNGMDGWAGMQTLRPRSHRQAVSVSAVMRAGGPRVPVHIRNISPRGMLVEAADPPARGTYVELIGPNSSVTGQVLWTRGNRFALRTRERLDLTAAHARQARLKIDDPAILATVTKKPVHVGASAQRSQHFALRFQNIALLLCGVLAAAGLATVAYLNLAPVFARVATALG